MEEVISFYQDIKTELGGSSSCVLEPRVGGITNSEKLPDFGLSADYLDFIENYNTERVAIGFLSLDPLNTGDIVQSIYELNGENKNPCIDDQFIHIASFEADPMLIRKAEHMHGNSAIYFQDISTGFFPSPLKIAENFVQFIICMANLDFLGTKNCDDITSSFRVILDEMTPPISNQQKTSMLALSQMVA